MLPKSAAVNTSNVPAMSVFTMAEAKKELEYVISMNILHTGQMKVLQVTCIGYSIVMYVSMAPYSSVATEAMETAAFPRTIGSPLQCCNFPARYK